jgi:hypothetical protein
MIRIPINEEGNEKAGQITEYLDKYNGEGIQHIAMGSKHLPDTVDALQLAGIKLLDTSATYYELLPKRIPGLKEDIEALKARNILVDGKAESCSCKSSAKTSSARSFSSSFSARAMKALAKATSKRCLKRWSSIRCAEGL